MRITTIVLMCFIAINTYSQEIEVGYFPKQKKGTSDQRFNRGKKTLENTYKKFTDVNYKPKFGDFWGLATGFNQMGENPEKIYTLLKKAKEINPAHFCVFIDVAKVGGNSSFKENPFYITIGDKFLDLVASCSEIDMSPPSLEDRIAEKERMDLSGLNEPLIDRLIILIEKEQRYRGGSTENLYKNKALSKKLDIEVEIEVIKIFKEYGYPGKDVVGEHYQSYLCLLLEHTGKLPTIEKYIPFVAKAFKKNQLEKTPFKMLIDRMYSSRNDTQIFGSHVGVPFANDKIIAQVKKEYGFLDVNSSSKVKVGEKSIIIKKQ